MRIIGLMSGTSLDGLDMVYVEFSKNASWINHQVLKTSSKAYDQDLRNRIFECSKLESSNVQKICSLNFELGKFYALAILEFLKENEISSSDVDYIANHGQTIWHNPAMMDGFQSSSLQIGESSVIAALTNISVIDNFRVKDLALGGEGAPLIPFSEFYIYGSKTENICLQNIGGIGNITYLKKGGSIEDIIAFDTGPGNMLIDKAVKYFFNKNYDENGLIAASGKINQELFREMKKDPYYEKPYPKSTGREKYSEEYFEVLLGIKEKHNISHRDFITTLTFFTAYTIGLALKNFKETDSLILGGGGAYNETLVEFIKKEAFCKVLTQEEAGYDSQYKEALGFAFLGYACANNLSGNITLVTGASKRAILGKITPA